MSFKRTYKIARRLYEYDSHQNFPRLFKDIALDLGKEGELLEASISILACLSYSSPELFAEVVECLTAAATSVAHYNGVPFDVRINTKTIERSFN